MKTKDGYTKWSNGYITLFFLDISYHAFKLGIRLDDISILVKSACLELDDLGLCNKSSWSSVRTEFDLKMQIRRARIYGLPKS